VQKVERLLYLAEYKRRQAAPGVKISARNFGRDRRYPITNRFRDTDILESSDRDARIVLPRADGGDVS
jgi:NAD+ synthase